MRAAPPRLALDQNSVARRRQLAAVVLAPLLAVAGLAATAAPSAAEVPSSWTAAAGDGFTRSVSSGWGTADLGGTYRLSGKGSTDGGVGLATVSGGGGFVAELPGVVKQDVDVSDTVTLRTAATTVDVMSTWIGRKQSDGSQYNATVQFNQSGKATLAVTRVNGSSSTWLQGMTLPFTVKAGQAVRGDLQITGTNPVVVRARAVQAGSALPAWQIQYSDSSSSRVESAGWVGVRNYAVKASSELQLAHDDLSVGSPAGARVEVPASTPARGTSLGSQAYQVPAGAVFVDGSRGSDSASGTQSSPLRSVGAAVSKAPTGGTVVVRSGVYHESVTSSRTVTVQNYPGEKVWFDGSVPVTSWTKTGTTWVTRGWMSAFDSSMGGASTKARYIGNNPMAADPDQVFLNGAQLVQVASASRVGVGQFAVDDSAHTITIGSDPAGAEVRASDLMYAFKLSGQYSTIQGVGVRRYATQWDVGAAVRLSSPGGTLRDMVITDNAMQGVALSNKDKVVDHLVVTGNGQLGIGGTELDNGVVENSVVDGNNTQDFKDAPVSGGIKITRSRVIKTANNEVKNNKSAGIWFDASCYQVTAVGNDVEGNRSTQIEVETAGTAIIADNTTIGGTTGILVYNSSSVKIYNNRIGDYSSFGVKLAQDHRRQADASVPEAHDPRRPIPDPTVTWITKDVTVVNNVFGNSNGSAGFQFYALDGETNRSADSMNIVIDGNLFVKRVNKAQTEPTMVAWGQGDNHTLVRYETPSELKSKNSTWVNAQAPASYRIGDMDPYITQNASVAKALPSDVAAAAGLAAGSKVLGTY